jgi:hypothetical protein
VGTGRRPTLHHRTQQEVEVLEIATDKVCQGKIYQATMGG